ITANNGLSYQWQDNGSNISNNAIFGGATNNTLTITGATAGMNGHTYQCVVSGTTPCAAVNSTAATLTVYAPPTFTTQPVSSTICAGSNTSFTVTVSNGLTFQWQDNGSNISNNAIFGGATTTTLTITGATVGMNTHTYQCVVTGTAPCTAVTSTAATLTVNTAATITCIGNQSVNTGVGVCTAVVSYSAPTVTGIPAPTITYSFSGATGG